MNNNSKPEILAQEYKPETTQKRVVSEHLPEQVKKNIELDKLKYSNDSEFKPSAPILNTPPKKSSLREKFNEKFKNIYIRRAIIAIIVLFSLFVLCFGSLFILTVTNTDVAIFKITLSGKVSDVLTKNGIENAEIYINDELKGKTNTSGQYSISGLNLGSVDLKIKTTDYQELNQEVPINRLFLNYNTKRDFELTPKEKAIIDGKVSVEDASYKFIDDRVYIDEQEFRIKTDGTFRIEGITVGNKTFKFKSLNYKDLSNSIEVKPGINKLPDISLTPSGDIDGSLISYITQTVVTDIRFNVENVQEEQIEIDEAKFKLRDLEVGREYSIQAVARNYLTRDYKITIKQGINQLFDFRLVEAGTSVNLKLETQSNNLQFYSSDFDGLNLKKLTSFPRNTDIGTYFFNNLENKVYFQSEKDKIRTSSGSGNVSLVYELDLNNLKETRITQNTSKIERVIPNYRAKRMTNIERVRNGNGYQYVISVMDLNGENRTDIKTFSDEINNAVLSDDGKYLFLKTTSGNNSILRRFEVSNKQEEIITQGALTLLDVTWNGQKVLFSKTNTQTNFQDLTQYTFNNKESRVIKANHDGSDYQFFLESENEFVYIAKRANNTNIYKYNINDNSEIKLTEMNQVDVITDIFQQSEYLFYSTSNSLYVLDPENAFSYKKVR